MNGAERNIITDTPHDVTFITAAVHDVAAEEFAVEADVGVVVDHHGPGVYTVQVWATLDGEPAVISALSVFHEVEVPEGYEPRYGWWKRAVPTLAGQPSSITSAQRNSCCANRKIAF